jgi:ornithine cyclodeaminase/alanine dehydrogenase-like protein (mu-crystallin family)
MSPKQLDDAIRRTPSGSRTPSEAKLFDKVGAGVGKMVMNKLVQENLKNRRKQ